MISISTKKRSTMLIFSLFIIFFSCQKDSSYNHIEKKLIYPYEKAFRLYDSIPLNNVTGISLLKDKIFINDHMSRRVIELDSALEMRAMRVGSGKGPCEVLSPIRMQKGQNEIYVLGSSNKHFLRLGLDQETCTSKNFKGRVSTDFDIVNSTLIYSSINGENSIVSMDFNSGETHFFGKLNEPPIASNKYIYNYRHIAVNQKGYIFALPHGIPIIEVYGPEGNFIHEFSIADIPIISSRMKYVLESGKRPDHDPNSVYILYDCITKKDDKLYLLATDHFGEKDHEFKTNTILQFDINTTTPIWEDWFELQGHPQTQGNWYTAFDILDAELIAFDGIMGEIHRFKLP